MWLTIPFCAIGFLILHTVSAFSSTASNNVAIYWGQNSANSGQQSLQSYCDSDSVDIILLSFLSSFPDWSLNLAGDCSITAGQMCPDAVGQGIEYCQQRGKIVMLSLGGEAGTYGFTNSEQAVDFAATLWNTFGGGSDANIVRPFGNAIVDGFDLDIENKNQNGYSALVNALREKYASNLGRQYYVSAAPQCVYPDASVGAAMEGASLDFAFIQFYNNYCNLNGGEFNWAAWANYATQTSQNKNIRLYVGLPGSAPSAGSGYASIAEIKANLPLEVLSSPNFGGISLWDMASSFANSENGVKFADGVKQFLGGLTSEGPQSIMVLNTMQSATLPKMESTRASIPTSEIQFQAVISSSPYSAVINQGSPAAIVAYSTAVPHLMTTLPSPAGEIQSSATIKDIDMTQAQALADPQASLSSRIGNKVVVAGRLIDPTITSSAIVPTQATTSALHTRTVYNTATVIITQYVTQ